LQRDLQKNVVLLGLRIHIQSLMMHLSPPFFCTLYGLVHDTSPLMNYTTHGKTCAGHKILHVSNRSNHTPMYVCALLRTDSWFFPPHYLLSGRTICLSIRAILSLPPPPAPKTLGDFNSGRKQRKGTGAAGSWAGRGDPTTTDGSDRQDTYPGVVPPVRKEPEGKKILAGMGEHHGTSS